ncbi:unannotated protein [freshwater metagenome]|uniref:Unannotated protein n=1 Tax=freshwater metagenome TaxID=449393 RepID=A0A6J7HUJ8_9ZZZZ
MVFATRDLHQIRPVARPGHEAKNLNAAPAEQLSHLSSAWSDGGGVLKLYGLLFRVILFVQVLFVQVLFRVILFIEVFFVEVLLEGLLFEGLLLVQILFLLLVWVCHEACLVPARTVMSFDANGTTAEPAWRTPGRKELLCGLGKGCSLSYAQRELRLLSNGVVFSI